jgi:hypothetical protein
MSIDEKDGGRRVSTWSTSQPNIAVTPLHPEQIFQKQQQVYLPTPKLLITRVSFNNKKCVLSIQVQFIERASSKYDDVVVCGPTANVFAGLSADGYRQWTARSGTLVANLLVAAGTITIITLILL